MADIFKPDSLSIKQVFDADNYYQVPSYQRPYSWDNEQIDELWDDLFSAFEEGKEEYFLGSIIVSKGEKEKYLDVIDGQQRLTTLMILFCVLRDLYYKDHKEKNSILGRIRSLEDSENRLKLRTQIHNQNHFEQDILNGIDFTKKRKISEIKADKFINAALRFKEKVDSITGDKEKIEGFKEYILEKVKVILVKCSDPTFAMKLFEVLNTRGLDLTAADIIKSNLMGRLKQEDWETFEQEWISMEEKAKQSEESISNLLTYYEYYILAKNPKKTLQEELIKEFGKGNSLKIISEIKKFFDFYLSIFDKKSKIFYSLRYLKHDVYWKSIVLSAKMEGWDDDDVEDLGEALRKFYYLYWMADYTTSKTKQTSFNIISWIKSGKELDFIEKEIEKKILEDKIVTRLYEGLNGNTYDSAWCKPLLILIEYEQIDTPRQDFMEIDRNIQVEHILPREYKKDKYWLENQRFTEESADLFVNTIGNLTLLSGKKNIAASCHSFPSKLKNNYKGNGEDGTTGFLVTQKIIHDAVEEKSLEWNEEKIKKRKQWILEQIEDIFDIEFENADGNEKEFLKYGKILEGKSEWKDKGVLLWRKNKLAASDVERSPAGNVTGRLKLVKSNFKVGDKLIDQTSYFREKVFGNLEWAPKEHTEKEIAEAIFVIKVMGEDLGVHRLTIGHNPYGEAGQNNYTTHISWGGLSDKIKKLNLEGKMFSIYAPPEGQREPFYIEIK